MPRVDSISGGGKRTLVIAASVVAVVAAPALRAQTSLADQKAQAEINKLEAEQQAIQLKALSDARATVGGGTTQVTAPEMTAEGMLLVRRLQENAADQIAAEFIEWRTGSNPNRTGPVMVVMGDQPPSIAEFLAVRESIGLLKQNLQRAHDQWTFAQERPRLAINPLTVGLILTGVNTAAAMLRTNTTMAGAAVNTPNEQFRAMLLERLRNAGVNVESPRTVAGEPVFATQQLASLAGELRSVRADYDAYLADLREVEGKVERLPRDKQIAGANLASALADYETLRRALYTPVNGILPASQLDEQESLYNERTLRPILYIYSQRAALTTTTRQGMLSGLRGVPAYVSASSVIDYGFAGETGRRARIVTSTPVMRITGVRAWATARTEPADQRPASDARTPRR